MRLSLSNLDAIKLLCDNFPSYDIAKVREDSIRDPHWLAFGSGNIFRGYIARINQDLINKGLSNRGISVVESFDEQIIDKTYRPFDNLSLSVTLNKDGNFNTNLIGNLVESLKVSEDYNRLEEIFKNDDLQIVSFTITEKGYSLFRPSGEILDVVSDDLNKSGDYKHIMSVACNLLYKRFKHSKAPVTMLSLDNCSNNGDILKRSILYIARAWVENGIVEREFLEYLNDESFVTFPLSVIDKITPRPSERIESFLVDKGFSDIDIVVTDKNSYVAPFINSEEAEYLVIENKFANGRDKLEDAGVYIVDRDTTYMFEKMKVTTCLNPLHTTLAIYGCLLGYDSIYEEMKDDNLVSLIKEVGYNEGLSVVVDPKILTPKDFIDEVINVRFPNPFIPDTPQRIATDTSQKIPIRFGETIKSYLNSDSHDVSELKYIPLVLAGWLRYLMGVDDNGEVFELSSDPLLDELKVYFKDLSLGNVKENNLIELLKNDRIFGVDLVKVGLSDLVLKYFYELSASKGAIRETLKKYLG